MSDIGDKEDRVLGELEVQAAKVAGNSGRKDIQEATQVGKSIMMPRMSNRIEPLAFVNQVESYST